MQTAPTWEALAIDKAGTKVFDDAFIIQAVDDGWLVTVCVTDVASRVDIGSPLDEEARLTGMTIMGYNGDPTLRLFLEKGHMGLQLDINNPVVEISVFIDKIGRTYFSGLKLCTRSICFLNYHHVVDALNDKNAQNHSMLTNALAASRALLFYRIPKNNVHNDDKKFLRSQEDYDIGHAKIIVREINRSVNSTLAQVLHTYEWTALYNALEPYGYVIHPDMSYHLVQANFTSPARTYADLVNQRIAIAFISGMSSPYTDIKLQEMASYFSTLRRLSAPKNFGGDASFMRVHYAKSALRRALASKDSVPYLTQMIKHCLWANEAPNDIAMMIEHHGIKQSNIAMNLLCSKQPTIKPLQEALLSYIRKTGSTCSEDNAQSQNLQSVVRHLACSYFGATGIFILNNEEDGGSHLEINFPDSSLVVCAKSSQRTQQALSQLCISSLEFLLSHIWAGTLPEVEKIELLEINDENNVSGPSIF
jgi:RNB domain